MIVGVTDHYHPPFHQEVRAWAVMWNSLILTLPMKMISTGLFYASLTPC